MARRSEERGHPNGGAPCIYRAFKSLIARTETEACVPPDELDQVIALADTSVKVRMGPSSGNVNQGGIRRRWSSIVHVIAQIARLCAALRIPGVDIGVGHRFRQ